MRFIQIVIKSRCVPTPHLCLCPGERGAPPRSRQATIILIQTYACTRCILIVQHLCRPVGTSSPVCMCGKANWPDWFFRLLKRVVICGRARATLAAAGERTGQREKHSIVLLKQTLGAFPFGGFSFFLLFFFNKLYGKQTSQ